MAQWQIEESERREQSGLKQVESPTGQVLKLSVGRMHRLHREIRSGGFTQRVREKTNMESQRADGMHKIAFHCWQQ